MGKSATIAAIFVLVLFGLFGLAIPWFHSAILMRDFLLVWPAIVLIVTAPFIYKNSAQAYGP
jgi:hypothetical protein